MKDYIIRTKSGKERCIVADNVAIDIINKKVTFWHKYSYCEYNGEYCTYYCNKDVTEIPLGEIASISVIRYERFLKGGLEVIYDATKHSLDFGRVLKDVMKKYN